MELPPQVSAVCSHLSNETALLVMFWVIGVLNVITFLLSDIYLEFFSSVHFSGPELWRVNE